MNRNGEGLDPIIETDERLIVGGANRQPVQNRIIRCNPQYIDIKNSRSTIVQNCANPQQYPINIDITADAKNTKLVNNFLNGGAVTDNGENTYREYYGGQNKLEMAAYADETANRTLGTWYQNTGRKPLAVQVIARDSTGARIAALMNINTSQTDQLVDGASDAGNGTNETIAGVSGVVPPGHYYKVAGSGLDGWYEATIG